METVRKFHLFWAWEDEREEGWLREMSRKGFHLKAVGMPGSYTFTPGTPGDTVYRLDYFKNRKDRAGYLQFFQDAGWIHIGEMSGWQYFRKEATDGEAPEIYSDNGSKANKYQRILLSLIIFLPLYSYFFLVLNRGERSLAPAITLFMFLLMLVYVYAMVRLLLRITRLKKRSEGRI
jgi:hypothetical protein